MEISRREILKSSALLPLLPYLKFEKKIKVEECYKIVRRDLTSICHMCNPWVINYIENKWVFPKENSKIFVFSKLEDARLYKINYTALNCLIYKSHCINLKPADPKRIMLNWSKKQYMCDLWKNGDDSNVVIFETCDSKTFMFCDALKLLEKVA